jgi:hypothetical protein
LTKPPTLRRRRRPTRGLPWRRGQWEGGDGGGKDCKGRDCGRASAVFFSRGGLGGCHAPHCKTQGGCVFGRGRRGEATSAPTRLAVGGAAARARAARHHSRDRARPRSTQRRPAPVTRRRRPHRAGQAAGSAPPNPRARAPCPPARSPALAHRRPPPAPTRTYDHGARGARAAPARAGAPRPHAAGASWRRSFALVPRRAMQASVWTGTRLARRPQAAALPLLPSALPSSSSSSSWPPPPPPCPRPSF